MKQEHKIDNGELIMDNEKAFNYPLSIINSQLSVPSPFEVISEAKLYGQYRFTFLNEDDTPISHDMMGLEIEGQDQWHDNLLLDKYLDYIGTNAVETGRIYLAVGTGSTDVKRDSGAITASQSSTTVTASAAFFVAGDVGRDIVWTGFRAKITAFTNSTTVTVNVSQTVASAIFKLEYVEQTALVSEVQRTNSNGGFANVVSYSTGGNLYTYDVTTTRVLTLAANQTLTEFGFSEGATSGSGVNIRELFRDVGGNPQAVTIASGKKVRVDHRLQVRIPYVAETKEFSFEERDAANNTLPQISAATNATPIQITTTQAHGYSTGQKLELYGITGNTGANGIFTISVIDATNFTLNGSVGNGVFNAGTGRIARRISASTTLFTTSPATPNIYLFETWQPSSVFQRFSARFSSGGSSSPSAVIGSTTDLITNLSSNDSYATGSFQRRKKNVLAEAEANGDMYAWMLSGGSQNAWSYGYKIIMDPEKITKLNTHTLELSLLSKWSRA